MYEIEVVTRGRHLLRAGFQLSVRFGNGRQAGTLSAAPDPMRVAFTHDTTLTIAYAHHTQEGTRGVTAETMRWRLRWTAPGAADSVILHVASVIASDDNSPLDDEVLTASRTVAGQIP